MVVTGASLPQSQNYHSTPATYQHQSHHQLNHSQFNQGAYASSHQNFAFCSGSASSSSSSSSSSPFYLLDSLTATSPNHLLSHQLAVAAVANQNSVNHHLLNPSIKLEDGGSSSSSSSSSSSHVHHLSPKESLNQSSHINDSGFESPKPLNDTANVANASANSNSVSSSKATLSISSNDTSTCSSPSPKTEELNRRSLWSN
jgi:hypothetical protein